MTRRELISQGFQAGAGTVLGSSALGLLAHPIMARAALSSDLQSLSAPLCEINPDGNGKIPFICIDLAGGANISGSNVLVGGPGGQLDYLTTAGYSKLGLPGDMIPGIGLNSNTDSTLGLAFHSDSQFLRGIIERVSQATADKINGAVIPARSDNDTGNNPHSPLYGIARAGAGGELLGIIGSRSTISGANSMAPAMMIDPSSPPTKIDRPSDVVGLVDTGDLSALTKSQAVAAMETMHRISAKKMQNVNTGVSFAADQVVRDNITCAYVKSAHMVDKYGGDDVLNPDDRNADTPLIVSDNGGIFSESEFDTDSEFRKTASVMKMVIDGYAGAGSITMGGYDYHTGDRATGELRDLRAGRCMGACLEYAARKNKPLMLYVYSDGSVFSNGMVDDSINGRGKGVWTGDNSSTGASFFLLYDPSGRVRNSSNIIRQQIGWMRPDASVETSATPAANNVNLLVETVILNYMALHGETTLFDQPSYFPVNGLGSASNRDNYIAFDFNMNQPI